jgi:7-carboxy-7-deazaguanine synthase
MSISPKFASSGPSAEKHPHWSRRHERERHRPDVVRRLIAEHDYQVKFVVDTPADLDELDGFLAEIPEIVRDRVLLMPQGIEQHELDARALWLRPYCEANRYVFCPRKQIEWYGPVRGT